jgi:transcription antitermination factor NusG
MADNLRHKEETGERFWYALYTRSRSEKKAAEQLQTIDITYYLPVIYRWKKWSDRKKKVAEPILKGYIFIFADERERMLSVEQNAIVRCVFDIGRPARIPEWQINNLKKMLSDDTELLIKDGLVPGVKVKIKEGPLEGVIGVVCTSDKGNTIAISIDILSRSVIAHLPKESVFEVLKDI